MVVSIVGARLVSKAGNDAGNAEAAQLRSVFSALAEQTGLHLHAAPYCQDYWGTGVDLADYPTISGVSHGHKVDGSLRNDGENPIRIWLVLEPRNGVRWPKDAHLCRRKAPAWLSPAGQDVVRRLCAKDRWPSRVDRLDVMPEAIWCFIDHRKREVVKVNAVPGMDPPGIQGLEVGVIADPADLHAILDDLVLLAESLPSVHEP